MSCINKIQPPDIIFTGIIILAIRPGALKEI
jgi:hypothetical protein